MRLGFGMLHVLDQKINQPRFQTHKKFQQQQLKFTKRLVLLPFPISICDTDSAMTQLGALLGGQHASVPKTHIQALFTYI